MGAPGLVPIEKSKADALAISLGSVEPDWKIALRVWWSWQWRILIATILISIAVRWWFAFMGGAIGLGAWGYEVTTQIVIYVASALVSLYLFKDILDRDFGGFKVCVIPNTPPPSAEAASKTGN